MKFSAFLKNWKTTLCGAAVAAAAVIGEALGVESATIVGIATALGLIASRDGDKRSEDVGLGD